MTYRERGLILFGALLFSTIGCAAQFVGALTRGEWAWAGAFAIMLAMTLYALVSLHRENNKEAP